MTKANNDKNKIGKSELKQALVDQGMKSADADRAVTAVLDTMTKALQGGQSVSLPGIGTLSVKATAARTGVRPGTSEKIQIPAGKKVGFKVSTTLKGNL